MKRLVAVAMSFAAMAPAQAQISTEEAYQRMLERQRQHGAQTRPVPTTAGTPEVKPAQTQSGALHEAWKELLAHDYAMATRLFDGVLKREPRNPRALEGRAICRYEAGAYDPAAQDAAAALAKLAGRKPEPRQPVLAAAVIALAQNNPVRSIRLMRELMQAMEAHGQIDEQLQDVLGTALWRVKPQERFNPLVQEAGKYYMEYDKKLAAMRNGGQTTQPALKLSYDTHAPQTQASGEARWGAVWLDASEADRKWQAYAAAVAAVDSATAEEKRTAANLKAANWLNDQAHFVGNKVSMQTRERTYTNLMMAQADETKAQNKLADASAVLEHTEAPPFPQKIEPRWVEPVESQ